LYALAAGTVVSLLGFALTDALFHLMGVPREVATLGRGYLDTWLLGGPLVFGFFAIEATFRASGDTRTPFLLLMPRWSCRWASTAAHRRRRPVPEARSRGRRPRLRQVRAAGSSSGSASRGGAA